MNKEQTIQVFEQLGIKQEEYPPYTDPYTFSKQMKKFSLWQTDHICYGNSTVNSESPAVA